MEDKSLLAVIFQSVQLLVLVVGALWAYFRFIKENPLHPRMEFDLECNFLGPQHDNYLTSIIITAKNRGNVEHKFYEIRLRARGIKRDEPMTEFKKYAPMVNFPIKLFSGVNIVPEEFGYFFVRPGVSQAFNYATLIPGDIRFIIVRATFGYESTNELHTIERVFEVKTAANS